MVMDLPTFVEKPWGNELIWALTDQYAAKILTIKAGHQLSLQYHVQKTETIYLESGRLLLQLEDETGIIQEHTLLPGDSKHIQAPKKHRMIAIEDCRVFEVSTPQLQDVVRIQDSYGRVPEEVAKST